MKRQERVYQTWAREALWNQLHSNHTENPLVVMATGLGKSMTMAMIMWQLLDYYPHLRIMQLTHVKELIAGNYRTLKEQWPDAPAGIYSAGLGERNHRQQITFAGIMSVAKRPATFGHIDFVIIDEAHRCSDNDNASYGKFLASLRKVNPNLIVIGFTATDFRMSSGMLTDGDLFDKVCYNIGSGETFVWAIQQGYLCRPVPKHPGFQLNTEAIRIVAGEYDPHQASSAMRDQNILERAVDLTIQLASEQNRKCWLTFNQSIEDAELVADMFTYKGYPHRAVHSKRDDRDESLAMFKRGEIGLTNKDVLTTGMDFPAIDLILGLRLTRSPGLWVQMIGRGTRPVFAPGYDINTLEGRLAAIAASPKQDCLVLDFCGNTERLGPINYPVIPRKAKKGEGGGEAPCRLCKKCDTYNPIHNKICEECGEEFPPPERLKPFAGESALVVDKSEPPPEFISGVQAMTCSVNEGKEIPGKPKKHDTMKVTYSCDGFPRSTFVCFDHPNGSYPRGAAERWWRMHGGRALPASVEEAVEHAHKLRKPKFVKYRLSDKFSEILDYDFRGTKFVISLDPTTEVLYEPDVMFVHEPLNKYDDIPF